MTAPPGAPARVPDKKVLIRSRSQLTLGIAALISGGGDPSKTASSASGVRVSSKADRSSGKPSQRRSKRTMPRLNKLPRRAASAQAGPCRPLSTAKASDCSAPKPRMRARFCRPRPTAALPARHCRALAGPWVRCAIRHRRMPVAMTASRCCL